MRHNSHPALRRAIRCVVEALEDRRLLAVNYIVAENLLPGTPQEVWDITGAGDLSIQGFATDISVDQGQTVRFKIDNDNQAAYHIDIYRLGWYGGNGARLVTTISSASTLRVNQPEGIFDSATGLYDCGNWSVTAQWNVPTTAVSGVYLAKVIRDDTGGASHIPFIVRDDDGQSDILFQTSDSTWQAYNNYGGKSLYNDQSSSGARAYKVSYNRPLVTRGTSGINSWLFTQEFPMIRWLERNGYSVSYFTNVDAARRGNELLEHKAVLSVGHDEYWSNEQWDSFQTARDSGVNLAFFSGNEVFWKTRWENSTVDAANGGFRTLVCYKETSANAKIDPLPNVWTGTWRDPRFSPPADGGQPENALTGTIFTVNGVRDDTITVPSDFSNLRFWRNTGVASLQPGQTATLAERTLGYEWDEDLDNGHRPAGLIRLSSTTVNVNGQYLLDYGSTYGSGSPTHSLTLYRAASGALVFGAGTCQWQWGLDGTHDRGETTPSRDMQQATLNLFADMGVQPGSKQSDLVAASASTDTLKPTSVITSPLAGANLAAGVTVNITGTASDGGGGVVASVEVSTDGGQTWHRATGKNNWTYNWTPTQAGSVRILTRAVDDSVNMETPSAGVSVNVTGTVDQTIFGFATPIIVAKDDNGPVELGVRFRSSQAGFITGIRFYKGPGNGGTHTGSLWSASGQLLATATFTNETASGWQEVKFGAPVPILANTIYVASYYAPQGHYAQNNGYFNTVASNGPLTALSDSEGGNGVYRYGTGGVMPASSYQASNYWVDVSFSIEQGGDTVAPTVISRTPAPGATDVPTNTALTARFSEMVTGGSIVFELRNSSGALVAGNVSYNAANLTATFTPTSALAQGATYTATVSGATDAAGNVMTLVNWSFTTASTVTSYSVFASGSIPAITAADDTEAVELGMRFRTSQNGFITGVRFYKGTGNGGTHTGSLWSATGQLLGGVTFLNETTEGWQTAMFASPVAVTANTQYVVSYHAPQGHYAKNTSYFTSSVASGPLYAYADGDGGGNGVYQYGSGGVMPANSYQSTNYWVDVVFSAESTPPGDVTPPTIISRTPAPGATDVPTNTALTARFSEAVTGGSIVFELRNSSGALVAGNVSYNAATLTATLTPTSALSQGATYTATVSGATDAAGNVMLPINWVFTTAAGTTVDSSLFPAGAVPTITAADDGDAVELGMRFRVNANGVIKGIRFYKGAGNGGTHTGSLWSASGTLLGSVTFSNETAEGWQIAMFASPVAVTANTQYVVSYHAPQGHYAKNTSYFQNAVASGPIYAYADGDGGGNGVYRYGTGGVMPTSSYQSTNYWVDVVFSTESTPPGDMTPPTILERTPAVGAVGIDPVGNITVRFSEAMLASSINAQTLLLTNTSGTAVAAAVSYNSATNTATLDPTANLAGGTTFNVRVVGGANGVKDLAGNALAADSVWSFSTLGTWTQTTAGDFNAGTNNGTQVNADGSVQIASGYVFNDDFTGTSLGSGWTTNTWTGGGTPALTVSNGTVRLGAYQIRSNANFNGKAIEGRISFGAAINQHFGLATNTNAVSGNSWAIFSTRTSTTTLYARVNSNGTQTEVSLGTIPSGFHTYRIEPIATGFRFYIDGTLSTTIARTISASASLRATLSAARATPVLQADWIRVPGYPASANFISSIFDAGRVVQWNTLSRTANLPAGTSLLVETRSGSTATPDGTWSSWSAVAANGTVSSPAGRYLQYRLTLTSTNGTATPVVLDVTLLYT